MGTDTIVTAIDGVVIPSDNHNSIKGALTVDLLPRNTSGVVTDQAGDLGSSSYEWKKVYVNDIEVSGAIDILPSGLLVPYAGQSAPTGWLFAAGETIGDTGSGANYAGPQYETLFNLIKFGYGNAGTEVFGTNTVLLPDPRGRFIRGKDRSAGIDPQGDSTEGTTRGESFKSHNHRSSKTRYSSGGSGTKNYNTGWDTYTNPLGYTNSGYIDTDGNGTKTIEDTGSTETAPTHMVLNHIIKI